MPKLLPILNDPPYGTERSHNGLRLALSLAKAPDVAVGVQQSIAVAVGCAIVGQRCPDGYYHLERKLRGLVAVGAGVGACGSCLEARGIARRGPDRGRPSLVDRRAYRVDPVGRQGRGLLSGRRMS